LLEQDQTLFFKLLLLFYTAYYPQPSLVLVQSVFVWHLPLKFHLKCPHNSKWNCKIFPRFT